ncbi:PAS domain S-box protein [Bacillus lacus]|uniref:histidine kinase n=1 Tax=Metabacillus lacus TaxID=1983721 RepID=A0A7X2J0V7_9BACI|nr:PAS domain-containing sensor histidine kinase [Metabacillus lacus]MRX73300.1 PAS domain S-box protein [Metabacillus lacus]
MNHTMMNDEVVQMRQELDRLRKENDALQEKLFTHEIMFHGALDAIMVFDEYMNFINVNAAACEMFKLSREHLLNRNLSDFLSLMPADELERQSDILRREGIFCGELLLKLDGGDIKFIEFTAKNRALGRYHLTIMRDISSKKMLERERIINEQLFKDLFNRAVDGIIIFDDAGNFIDANQSFCHDLEIDKGNLAAYYLHMFAEAEEIEEQIWSSLRVSGRAQGELTFRLKSGQKKIFEFTTSSNILNGFYMSIMRDITEKRMMEMRLYKSEERFREIFENAIDSILIVEKDGRIAKANQSACRTFELPLEKLMESNIMNFIDKQDSRFIEVAKRYSDNGAIRDELKFSMPNGQCKELEFTSKMNIFDSQHLIIARNVSDRKEMEKELRESELKFRKIFNGAMDGIVLFNDSYDIVDANPIASKIINISLEKLKNSNLYELFCFDKIGCNEAKRESFNLLDEVTEEFPLFLKNGQKVIVECSVKRNVIENLNLAIFRDVTERKELEERLRKSDTLNVVGELAAGIAHEIRNPMTALKGFIQLLQGSVKGDYPMYFNVITSELKRIESIITEFLVLAKPQAVHYQQESAVKIMKETIELLNAQAIMANVQIRLSSYSNIPYIYCEPNQLKQVFINILKNAIEVMPKGGFISVTMDKKDEQHITICIRDKGAGIPEDKLKRLGEPFYTTKERGTGLGLMVSYKIIKEHRGKVKVESTLGEGTTFHITLPIHQEQI